MSFIVLADIQKLKDLQTETDHALGYPEQEWQFTHVGLGPWCPWTVGRALNYAPIDEHKDGGQYALPYTTKMQAAVAAKEISDPSKIAGVSVVAELPADWKPVPDVGLEAVSEPITKGIKW